MINYGGGFEPIRPRFLSDPVEVRWAGFYGRTDRMQCAGWQISAHQDIHQRGMQLAFKHEASGLFGITEPSEWDYLPAAHQRPRMLRMMAMGKPVNVHVQGRIDWDFTPIDAIPRAVFDAPRSLEDLVHFAPAASRHDLLVPSDTVPDLLDRIMRIQQPAKEERAKARVAARILVAV